MSCYFSPSGTIIPVKGGPLSMDQVKIGSFLKELRKEKKLTQETLAEMLGVSNRTVSRWETGSNMPDIGMLVEIAEFYDISIPEIINGERKSEIMNQEARETAEKMAEYSHNEVKKAKTRVMGWLISAFGIFVIISALNVFPGESSWGSIYSLFGSVILVTGIYFLMRAAGVKKRVRVMIAALCCVLLFGAFSLSDYVAVTQFNQVPRFRYETIYTSERPDEVAYKTLFFTAVHKNPGSDNESVEIITNNN